MESTTKGLTTIEAQSLQHKFGENTIEVERKFSTQNLLISQYKNIITAILLFATVFSLFIGNKIDAIFIFLVLLINGLFGFLQEYRAQKTIEKLKDLTSPRARVLRDGKEAEVNARDIVLGDVVLLREGDRIPADGKLVTNVALEVDESILTGESLPRDVRKQDALYAGTFVVRGRGYLEVSEVGFATKLGLIAQELEGTKKPRIPLAENLNSLGKRLAIIAVLMAGALVPIGAVQGRELKELILISVSIAVALIPEGLPLIVTIALAVGSYRMARRKTVVRKMASIETLGSTTIILADKTGTITQNRMTVKRHWLADQQKMDFLLRACVLGNTASLALKEDGGGYEVVGDPTDGALLSFAEKNLKEFEIFKNEGKIVEEKPFDPETKTIEVSWEHKKVKHTFLRGAPETILAKISEKERDHVERELENYTKEGLRVIGFAHKNLPAGRQGTKEEKLTFLALVGIYDAPREEAKQAIKEAESAGIRIVMVTGDNPVTAKIIAEDVGLIKEGELVVTHDEIEKTSDEELLKLLPRVRVFARMAPSDKLRLVRLYKQASHIVAVTGDGVNDALALSEAHIGVAMGGRGTDVAKEAADIVITDDNLYTIVKAVEEGRGIFDNIVKAVAFLLSTNLTEFFLIFFSVLLGLPIALAPTQILWINLVSDGVPAMALATDIKRNNLLNRKPRKVSEQILNWARLRMILGITFVFSLILIFIYSAYLNNSGIAPRLLMFNLLVIGEMIIIFIIRGGLFPINRFLIFSVIVTLLLQYLVSTVPLFRSIFGL